jgi:hypothetical protein
MPHLSTGEDKTIRIVFFTVGICVSNGRRGLRHPLIGIRNRRKHVSLFSFTISLDMVLVKMRQLHDNLASISFALTMAAPLPRSLV